MYRPTNKKSHRYVTKRNRKLTNSEKNQHKPPDIVPELQERQSENVGAATAEDGSVEQTKLGLSTENNKNI
jgi:hypothetical protein